MKTPTRPVLGGIASLAPTETRATVVKIASIRSQALRITSPPRNSTSRTMVTPPRQHSAFVSGRILVEDMAIARLEGGAGLNSCALQ